MADWLAGDLKPWGLVVSFVSGSLSLANPALVGGNSVPSEGLQPSPCAQGPEWPQKVMPALPLFSLGSDSFSFGPSRGCADMAG